MLYREFQGEKLSALGFGAMRLPVVDGDDANIDQAQVEAMVDYAMDHGINYYDTAWGYHAGNSEVSIGKALSRFERSTYNLATKFPGYDLSNMPKVKEIFEKQLEKCGVDYFDFYLVHNVCELNINEYLNPQHGIVDYLRAQKEAGRIRHLGFSAHGSRDVTERFLNAYGEHMEFCQLQLNYLDWEFQDARGKAELVGKWGIPVWVMEPLRGGRLARLSAAEEETLRAMRPDESNVAWAFRFLQSLPQVTMVLSGMSNLEQLVDNVSIFNEDKPLSESEMEGLLSMARGMVNEKILPCTACRYCTTHCPMELPIPDLLALYNEHVFTGGGFIAPMALAAYDENKKPAACIGCHSCEAVCPQQIKIADALADFAAML